MCKVLILGKIYIIVYRYLHFSDAVTVLLCLGCNGTAASTRSGREGQDRAELLPADRHQPAVSHHGRFRAQAHEPQAQPGQIRTDRRGPHQEDRGSLPEGRTSFEDSGARN